MSDEDLLGDALRARVERVLDALWPGVGCAEVAALRGGQSSLTFLATLDGAPVEQVVVKVAPPGLPPVRNRDVLRQARILDALAPVPVVPVPTVFGRDPGEPPEVPPLFVMAFVAGDSTEPLSDRNLDVPGADLHSRMVGAARMLGGMHAVPLDDLGLAAEPETSLHDEVERWQRAIGTLPDDLCPGAASLCERLLALLPPPVPARLVHGDWRLGNMLAVGAEIRAVIDWELWSCGDPRVDLAWFLLAADPAHPSSLRGPEDAGIPSRDALVRDYEAASGETLGDADLGWFDALVRLKVAVAWALIVKRQRAGGTPSRQAQRFAEWIPAVLARAGALLG